MRRRALLLVLVAAASSCRPKETPRVTDADASFVAPNDAIAAPLVPTVPPMPRGFLRGQLHTHSAQSADSKTPPRDVQRWYETHGWDFVVFTDHNTITDTDDTRLITIPGAEITFNSRTCDPPPPTGLMCPLHMNVLFTTAEGGPISLIDPAASLSRRDIYRHELAIAKSLGGIAMLNHPNMQFAADSATVFDLAQQGLTLMEVGNQSWDALNAGDAAHPSTETIWDNVLTRGAHVFGTVTDDAHFYGDLAAAHARGERPFPGGLGFVAVHAERNVASIRDAITRGDFYGSTGLLFETYELTLAAINLATVDAAAVDYEVIGKGGAIIKRVHDARLVLPLTEKERPYVRVRARRDDGTAAWTQPVFVP